MGSSFYDNSEPVQEMAWPWFLPAINAMRNDSRIRACEAAVTLPIRRYEPSDHPIGEELGAAARSGCGPPTWWGADHRAWTDATHYGHLVRASLRGRPRSEARTILGVIVDRNVPGRAVISRTPATTPVGRASRSRGSRGE